jgi:hypothetical protein
MPRFLSHLLVRVPGWLSITLFAMLALVPITFIAMGVIEASRDLVYWDEFDTVLDLLLALDSGIDARGFFERIFAINNEHRMMTSRLLFVASWWLTGTVDFRVIGAIGNLFLVALCLTLVISVHTTERRIRLAVILAFLMFQFGHFENLLWSGASIDHFQVVALAVGSIVLIARGTIAALIGAAVLSLLATFTLAHGLVMWPVGALMLWRARRRGAFWSWAALAGAAGLLYFQGFEVNSGHPLASTDAAGAYHVLIYWLSLLGAPLALGHASVAPFSGLALVAATGWLLLKGKWHHEPVMFHVVLFCGGALALIAIGRSEVAGGQLQSRYMVLSGLAWTAMIFTAIEYASHPLRPLRLLAACVPLLAAFNVASNVHFLPAVESFIEGRDSAALRFKQHGRLGHSPFRLYPVPERANQLLTAAAKRGLYWVPRMCVRTTIEDAKPSDRIKYFIDEMTADTPATFISGWAAIPEEKSRRGEIYLVLRSPTTDIIYTTVSNSRPDVAAAHSNPDWRLCGFKFAVTRWRLPAEELRLGILIKQGDEAEYIMTEHRLRPYGRGEALLANSQ